MKRYNGIRNTMNIHHTRTRDLLIAALAVAVAGNLLAAEKGAPKTSSQGSPFAFPAFTTPADAVRLKPGDDIQAAIDSHKPGTAFVLTKGLYRTGNLKPKEGNSLYGELNADGTLGTIFNGSRLIVNFQTLPNGQWAITGQTQQNGITQFQKDDPRTMKGHQRAIYVEDVFIDDTFLRHAANRNTVAKGLFYFDYPHRTVYIADDPRGKKVEVSFYPMAIGGTATGVTIRNIQFEKYAIFSWLGAVSAQGHRWRVEGCEARLNHGAGFTCSDRVLSSRKNRLQLPYDGDDASIGFIPDGVVFRNNLVCSNGLGGILCYRARNVLIEHNECCHNRVPTVGFAKHWNAGGIKIIRDTDDTTIRGNYCHHNQSPGIWVDGGGGACDNTVVEDNWITDNLSTGLSYEVCSQGTIRRNRFARNGWTQIHLWHSENTKVYANQLQVDVEFPGIGIVLWHKRKSLTPPVAEPVHNDFFENQINIETFSPGQRSGMVVEVAKNIPEPAERQALGKRLVNENSFHDNLYYADNAIAAGASLAFYRLGDGDAIRLTEAQARGIESGSRVVPGRSPINWNWEYTPPAVPSETPTLLTKCSEWGSPVLIGTYHGATTSDLSLAINGTTYSTTKQAKVQLNRHANHWSLALPRNLNLPDGDNPVTMKAVDNTGAVHCAIATLTIKQRPNHR